MRCSAQATACPTRRFQISNFPLLPESPRVTGIVQVDEGDGNGHTLGKKWPIFGLRRQTEGLHPGLPTGIVTFGDGVMGKIPHWWSADGSNLEAAERQYSGDAVSMWRRGGGQRWIRHDHYLMDTVALRGERDQLTAGSNWGAIKKRLRRPRAGSATD